jgi:hypothetical protein
MFACKCGLPLSEQIVPLNATRVALECKCGARVAFRVARGALVPAGTNPSSHAAQTAGWDALPSDSERLRASAVALADAREAFARARAALDKIEAYRAPVLTRERERVLALALTSARVKRVVGDDSADALLDVLRRALDALPEADRDALLASAGITVNGNGER